MRLVSHYRATSASKSRTKNLGEMSQIVDSSEIVHH